MDPMQNNGFDGQQPMNMGYPGVPMNVGAGDIVLNGSEGRSKKWWIVGGVIGVLLLCVVGCVLLFMSFQNTSRKEIEAAWNRYYDYLMYGESNRLDGESSDVTVETWYPAIIGTVSVQNEDDSSDDGNEDRYYDSLKERYDIFLKTSSQEIEGVEIYNDVFKAFYDYNVIRDLEKTIIDTYNGDGTDVAMHYIDGINGNLTKGNALVDGLYDNLKIYLQAYLSVVNYYNEKNCNYLEANYINCPEINSSSETMTVLEMLYRRRSNLDYYYREIYVNYVFRSTLLMNEQIKEKQ